MIDTCFVHSNEQSLIKNLGEIMSKTLVPGQAGGLALLKQKGTSHFAKIGRRGGRAVAQRYGSEYFSLLGALGADAVNGHLSEWKYNRVRGRINAIVSGR